MTKRTTTWLAFTLVEMLLALALTAILLSIVSVTIGSVLKDSQRLESMRSEPRWLESAIHVIRQDIVQAESYQITSNGFVLQSHTTIPAPNDNEQDDGYVNHDLMTIEYRIVNREEDTWLVRRVSPLKPALNNKPHPFKLVCGGIQDIQLAEWQTDEDSYRMSEQDEEHDAVNPDTDMQPMPDQMLLSITMNPSNDSIKKNTTDYFIGQQSEQAETLERLIVIH